MHPSASFSAAIRVRIENHPGAFARLAAAIGEAGGLLGAIDLVRVEGSTKIRDVNVLADDEPHLDTIVTAVRSVEGVEVIHVSDRVFLAHLGGKLEVRPRLPLKTRDDLSMVYTPGVARVSRAIAEDPIKSHSLTIRKNTVAVVSDGSAVLGLGNIGPEGALPVMEGKAVLFKEFADVDAFPICVASQKVDDIVQTVRTISSGSFVARQIGNASMPANSLNSTALPSITGIAASGPMSPSPSTAVPSLTMATQLRLIVRFQTLSGSSAMARETRATPGV